MKLLVVTQYFHPENFRVNELVAALVQRGHQVTVLTGHPNYPEGRFYPGYKGWRCVRESYSGAEVIRVPMLARGKGGGIRLLLNYLSFALSSTLAVFTRLRSPVDAVFVFQVSPITAGLAAIAASKRFRAPILFWVLDLWPESLQATGAIKQPRVLAWVAKGVKWIYSNCQYVLVQSRAFDQKIEALGFPADRIRYFPNWIESDYEMAAPADSLVSAEASNEFVVTYAGNIGAAQDFSTVVEAATQLAPLLPQLRWTIAGEGRMAPWLRSEVVRRGLQPYFRFLGQLPPSQMPALFACSNALLVSLRSDPVFALTVPGKVQSYLASGRPVLAMLDGEGARIVTEAGGGLAVPAGSAQELVGSIQKMAAMPLAERQAMGRRGQAYAHKMFGREALFSRLDEWLLEAVRNSRDDA